MYSIGNAPFRGVWVSCGDRCETATPTEAGAETNLTAYYNKRWEKFCNQ